MGTNAAAAYLGVHPNTIRLWAKGGLLPYAEKPGPGRFKMFRVEDLDAMKHEEADDAHAEH